MQQDNDTLFLWNREIGAVLEAYREKLPRKRKSNVQLRSVATTDGDAVAGESEDGGKENAGAADSAEQDDGTAAFKEQFPVPLKEPPSRPASTVSIAPESEAAAHPPPPVRLGVGWPMHYCRPSAANHIIA